MYEKSLALDSIAQYELLYTRVIDTQREKTFGRQNSLFPCDMRERGVGGIYIAKGDVLSLIARAKAKISSEY